MKKSRYKKKENTFSYFLHQILSISLACKYIWSVKFPGNKIFSWNMRKIFSERFGISCWDEFSSQSTDWKNQNRKWKIQCKRRKKRKLFMRWDEKISVIFRVSWKANRAQVKILDFFSFLAKICDNWLENLWF